MTELCKDLTLSIAREHDPDGGPNDERVRIVLANELEMKQVEIYYSINISSAASRKYHVRESVVIAMRRLVSEAFRVQLISDSPGEWKLTSLDELDLTI